MPYNLFHLMIIQASTLNGSVAIRQLKTATNSCPPPLKCLVWSTLKQK